MTNRTHSKNTGCAAGLRIALALAAASPAWHASGSEAQATPDQPEGTIGLVIQPPDNDPARIGEEADKWGRLLCRARFPANAKRCRDFRISQAVIESQVIATTPLTVVSWVDERRLGEAAGATPSGSAPYFLMPLCSPSLIAIPGEVIAETRADPRSGCLSASSVGDHGKKGDALTMARLRLIREVIATQASEDGDPVPEQDPDLQGDAPQARAGKLVALRPLPSAKPPEERLPKADLPDFPGDAFTPRSLMYQLD